MQVIVQFNFMFTKCTVLLKRVFATQVLHAYARK